MSNFEYHQKPETQQIISTSAFFFESLFNYFFASRFMTEEILQLNANEARENKKKKLMAQEKSRRTCET